MIPITGNKPETSAAIYRFEAPVLPLPGQAGASDVQPERSAPVSNTPVGGSVVLAGLAPSSALRAKWQLARKVRENAVANGRSQTGSAGARELQGPDAEDLLNFGASASLSKRHPPSGDGASRQAAGQGLKPPQNVFLQGTRALSSLRPTHMAGRALVLPELCKAQLATHGMRSMPGFLRELMQALVMDFVRDLADKIESRGSDEKKPLKGADVIQPVRESCDEFMRLMRPLYQRYVQAPSLYGDACDVLCAAEPLLQREMKKRGGAQSDLAGVMKATVFPLLPVLVMGCMPRPDSSAAAVTNNDEETPA